MSREQMLNVISNGNADLVDGVQPAPEYYDVLAEYNDVAYARWTKVSKRVDAMMNFVASVAG